MISVTISNEKVCEWLKDIQVQSGKTVDELVILCLKDYMRKYAPVQEGKPKESSVASKLIEFFSNTYHEKFKLNADELPLEATVQKVFDKFTKAVGNEQTAYEIMQKAIVWYLYMHKSENTAGKKFPYQFRILLEQQWLLRQCVESSEPYTIDMIKKAGLTNDPDTAAKLLKRGDLGAGFTTVSVTKEREALMKNIYRLQKLFHWPDSIRQEPEICKLYSAEIPSLEYVRNARKYLEGLMEVNQYEGNAVENYE